MNSVVCNPSLMREIMTFHISNDKLSHQHKIKPVLKHIHAYGRIRYYFDENDDESLLGPKTICQETIEIYTQRPGIKKIHSLFTSKNKILNDEKSYSHPGYSMDREDYDTEEDFKDDLDALFHTHLLELI